MVLLLTRLFDDDYFVVEYRADLNRGLAAVNNHRFGSLRDQQPRGSYLRRVTEIHRGADRANGDQFFHGRAPCGRIREVHQVKDKPTGLGVEMAVNQPGTAHFDRYRVGRSPANDVGEQVAMVGQVLTLIARSISAGMYAIRDWPRSDRISPGISVDGCRIQAVSGG